jgi:uncharacterized glyoxalase superfamily protein PhnB
MPRHALIPCLRYKDAPAAIEFLCQAFGFERHFVFADETQPSIIHHAQLTLDDNMIMLASADNGSDSARLYGWKTPQEVGGITMCVCAVIDDPDTHAERARQAGARIIREPQANRGYPGRAYDAADPEGNVWNFGSYDPWEDLD